MNILVFVAPIAVHFVLASLGAYLFVRLTNARFSSLLAALCGVALAFGFGYGWVLLGWPMSEIWDDLVLAPYYGGEILRHPRAETIVGFFIFSVLPFFVALGVSESARNSASTNDVPAASCRLRWFVWVNVVILTLAVSYLHFRDAFDSTHHYPAANKGRGIWTAVLSANMERDAVGAAPLWPEDVHWGDPPVPVKWRSAAQYFRYLMSSTNYIGNPLLAVPVEDSGARRVPDLDINMWVGPSASDTSSFKAFDDGQCRWHVCRINDDAPADTPFLITRNLHIEDGRMRKVGNGYSRIALDNVEPFGRRRVCWITKGGGVYVVSRKNVTESLLLPNTNEIEVITCR